MTDGRRILRIARSAVGSMYRWGWLPWQMQFEDAVQIAALDLLDAPDELPDGHAARQAGNAVVDYIRGTMGRSDEMRSLRSAIWEPLEFEDWRGSMEWNPEQILIGTQTLRAMTRPNTNPLAYTLKAQPAQIVEALAVAETKREAARMLGLTPERLSHHVRAAREAAEA